MDRNDGLTLNLYAPIPLGQGYLGDITRVAEGYSRIIRIQGGFWQGGFKIIQEPLSVIREIYYACLGAHFEERVGAEVTWEGMIYEMGLDDRKGAHSLDVRLAGYVFTGNWRAVTVSDGTTGNASAWIADILGTDCPVLTAGRIRTNTLQVYRQAEITQLAYDEIAKIAGLGDANYKPWAFWVDAGRLAHYEAISTTPRYMVKSGLLRRRSLDWMSNYVTGVYTKNDGTVATITPVSDARSIARYYRKEEHLSLYEITQAAADNKANVQLAENAWPSSRPVTSSGELQLYSLDGEEMQLSPWRIRPGVYRDYGMPAGGVEASTTWLDDSRDFLVDEVECSIDGGASIRTKYCTEADLLEVQTEYYEDARRRGMKEPRPKRKRRRR